MNPGILMLAGALWAAVLPTVEQFEAKLLHDTSGYRVSHGKPALQASPELMRAARHRSDDMRVSHLPQEQYLKHIGSDGKPFHDHIYQYAPEVVGVSENLCRAPGWAADWVTLNAIIEALQKSPRHNDNWLHEHYRYVGVGASTGPSGPYGTSLYITQVFAVGFEKEYNIVMFPRT